MSATLVVTHEVDFGIELRRGPFDVLLDGSVVGSAKNHERVESPVAPGRHSLQMRRGRYCSRLQTFEAVDGEVVRFSSHGARIWPLWLASFVKPSLAISLQRT